MSSSKMFGSNSAEMSKKLRAAIKAKLEELGVYVDEELPDYIMVMIANRKEKSQMKEDLLLFLGKSTNKFVDWLFEIFQRLQSAGATAVCEAPASTLLQQPNKKKEPTVQEKKESIKEAVVSEKKSKKERDNDSRRTDAKDVSKHREKDRKEPRVVKSKITFHHQSSLKSPTYEKQHWKKRIEVKTDGKEKEKKSSTATAEKVSSKDTASGRESLSKDAASHRINEREPTTAAETKKKKESESVQQKRVEEKEMRRDLTSRIQPREKKSYIGERNSSPKHITKHPRVLSPTEYIDSDEEERLAEEESRKELYSKKVLSSAVLKMTQSESVKTVHSKVIVKRKLPEKENTKNVRGAQSLFLKAIKEAGRMTRTASQMAGYGAGISVKKLPPKSSTATIEESKNDFEDDAIEIDDVDSIDDDTLVVTTSSSVTSNVQRQVDERGGAKTSSKINPATAESSATEKKERGSVSSNSGGSLKFANKNLLVTLKKADVGNVLRTVETNEEHSLPNRGRKRRSSADASDEQSELKQKPDELVVVKPKKLRDSMDAVAPESNLNSNTAAAVAIFNDETNTNKQSGSWDRQIPIEEEDSSDDEAQIDAVLASAHTITVGFDESSTASSPNAPVLSVGEVSQQSTNFNIPGSNVVQAGEPVLTVVSGEKIMERCKFWPNCRLEDACIYIHPTKPCSNFPNCKFGDRCIYLHYPCKFDRNCVNPHCPYVHSSKISIGATSSTPTSSASTSASSTTAVAAPLNASIACKYGGKCTNPSCAYKHPKLCRFGERCANRNCYFRHLNMLPVSTLKTPILDKYKWKATVST